jgi:hypothetical protein
MLLFATLLTGVKFMGEMIKSVQEYISAVKSVYDSWENRRVSWYRGQNVDKPLLPKVLREVYNEINMTRVFREKGQVEYETPDKGREADWLSLMQHHGLPTRLLDWTEGALIALFFAVDGVTEPNQPVVWMLNPSEMNRISVGEDFLLFGWLDPGKAYVSLAFWEPDKHGPKITMPAAIYPSSVDERMSAQRSCFTILLSARFRFPKTPRSLSKLCPVA